jgi:molybdopterin synthase catalytic subunit
MQETLLVEISGEALQTSRYTDFVNDPTAGAISTFTGVTRNSFQGKGVLRLE